MKHLRDFGQNGLTLVELLVALTLTTAIVAIVIGFSVDKLQQSSIQSIKFNLLSNAETGLNRVANDIRLATSADENNRWQDNNAPSAPGNLLSWASDGDTLVLATAAQDANLNVIFDDALDYISAKDNVVYYLQSGHLYRRTIAAPNANNNAKTSCPAASATAACPADKDVLQDVTSFSITYYGSDGTVVDPSDARSIQLSVTLLQHKYSQDIQAQYTTRMVFRNG